MFKLTTKGVIRRLADNASIPLDISNRDYRAYLEWVALGNTPQAADADPAPPDYSDSNNIDRTLKAVLMCVAQVGGLSNAQIRTMFKAKFDLLA